MRPLACLLVRAACSFPAMAVGGSFVRSPLEDAGLPLWCECGYHWVERCCTDNTARLLLRGAKDESFGAAALGPPLVVTYADPTTGPAP